LNKKMVLAGISAAVILGGATIAGATMNTQSDAVTIEEKPVEVAQTSTSEQVQSEANFISTDEAADIALSKYDGYIESIELEKDDGYVYYEVEIENEDAEYELDIDAMTGEILKVDEDDDNDDEQTKKSYDELLSVEEAKQIAVDRAGGGKVVELELEEDDNRYEYEIEINVDNQEAEVTIDAVTGDILEFELDD